MAELKNIACNVITGFLGSGKTTAILNLLAQKPKNETWAVLVNEFGKIGIDGHVLSSMGAAVKEIPGGCMCCSAGLPMQVALNSLIKESRPQRLLIEPTGIGHPRQILKQLSSPPFDTLLDIRACINLLDPRHLEDNRYTRNPLFNDQIAIADVLVANKVDQCNVQNRRRFNDYLKNLKPAKHASAWVEQGMFDITFIDFSHRQNEMTQTQFIPAIDLKPAISSTQYYSEGWQYNDQYSFDYECILNLIRQLKPERLKALLKTNAGDVFVNCINGNSSILKIEDLKNSQIEMISQSPLNHKKHQQQFISCTVNNA